MKFFKYSILFKILNIFYIFKKINTLITNSSNNIFVLNFYTCNMNISSSISKNYSNPLNIWSYNELYTIIPFGNDKKPLYALFSNNDFGFYLINGYGPINSKYTNSFNLNQYNRNIFPYKLFHIAWFESENFFLLNEKKEEVKIENFEIIEVSRENQTQNYFLEITNIKPESKDYIHNITFAILGFELTPEYRYEILDNFIVQLKKKKYINNYFWYLKYDENNDKEGSLIIGEIPKCFYNKYYKEVKALPGTFGLEWNFFFNEIYFIKKNNNNKIYITKEKKNNIDSISMNVNIDINQGIIISNIEYYYLIKEHYFDYLLNKSICYENEKNVNGIFNAKCFYCLKNKFGNTYLKNFPSLFFYNIELNYTFELNYKDLFKSYNNYLYFLVIFHKYKKNWTFGKIFFKKYQFYFNHDTKTISFCNYWNDNYKKSNKIIIIILVLLGNLFSCILFIFFKKISFYKRHTRSIEIELEFSYIKNE